MAAPVLEKHNVITYSLVRPLTTAFGHTADIEIAEWLTNIPTYCLGRDRTILADMLHGKANMLDYDAICTFVFVRISNGGTHMLSETLLTASTIRF